MDRSLVGAADNGPRADYRSVPVSETIVEKRASASSAIVRSASMTMRRWCVRRRDPHAGSPGWQPHSGLIAVFKCGRHADPPVGLNTPAWLRSLPAQTGSVLNRPPAWPIVDRESNSTST